MALFLRQLKIRSQVFALILPLILVLFGFVGLFFYNYWKINQVNQSVERSELRVLHTESLLQGINEMDSRARGYILTRQNSFLQGYHVASRSVLQEFVDLHDLTSQRPSRLAELGNLQKRFETWKTQRVDPLLADVKAGGESRGELINEQWTSNLADIQGAVLQFRQLSQKDADSNRSNRNRDIRWAVMSGVAMGLVFATLMLLLVHYVSREITEPVQQFISAAEHLRHGDFDLELPPEADNEFGVLSRSFKEMTEALWQDREELGALKRYSEAVTQCTSESEVYDQILHALRDRFQAQQVIIFKLRQEEDYLEVVASLNPLPEDLQEWPVIEGKHRCKAVRMGRPFRVNDVSVEPLCPAKFAEPTKGSYYCGPLIAGGIIIGAIRLQGETGLWTPERESLVESYLSTTASVLSNLHLLQTMREQANMDPLTGLYNRRFCKDYARKLMAMARRKDTPLGFIMMDLDHFKNINDVYGHEIGDRILKQFSKTVTQSMRETNLTARLGGEEFIILLPDTGAKACQVVAERIRNAVARMAVPQVKEKPIPPITVSLGIAVYPEHGGTLEEMLQVSDRALYESKRAGRNRSTLYAEEKEITG